MPSVDAIYTHCEDYQPHEAHPLGGETYCIGVSDTDGNTEDLKQMIDRIAHDQNVSENEAGRVALAELRFTARKKEKLG